jgi:sugar/nucleoside kinase (ribokinase family)
MQTLVIGSTVVDVILSIPAIPGRGEDVNITGMEYRIGGCAYNVFMALRLFDSPALLCSPVGSGFYGDMVREHMEKEGLRAFVSLEGKNGCCYCLVEPDGERSFLSHHGVEYLFSRSWMEKIDFSQADSVFICGLEVEDSDGDEIVAFVNEHPELELYFAPGPRINHIPIKRMESLLRRRDSRGKGPFLHLNKTEACAFSGKNLLEEAAEFLAAKTGNSLVITLGEQGCYYLSESGNEGRYSPPFTVNVVDTVGTGDAHCGSLIACLKNGMNLEEACLMANKAGAAVAGIRGAVLDRKSWLL